MPAATPTFNAPARLRAAGIHLLISLAAACCVLAIVYAGWYRGVLASLTGVGNVLVLLMAVDVTLGPFLTFIVFDRRKKRLALDLAVIAVMQAAAMLVGLQAVEGGRPHYIAFAVDRFEVVSRADLTEDDLAAAATNPSAARNWWGPAWVTAPLPDRSRGDVSTALEAALGGRDVQHFPQRYQSIEASRAAMIARSQPLSRLRDLNPDRGTTIDSFVALSGRNEAELRYLPIKGPKGDAAVLIDAHDGAVVVQLELRPW